MTAIQTPPPPREDAALPETSLADIVSILLDAKWLVGGIAAGVIFVVALYALLAAPIYTPTSLVQVDQKAGGLTGLETLSSLIEGTALPVQAEIQLAKSASVLQAAIRSQHADILVRPRRFLLLGAFAKRFSHGARPASAFLGLSSFSWGNDRLVVTQFRMPTLLLDQDFTVTITGPDSYRLNDPAGALVLTGRTGMLAQTVSHSALDTIAIEVDKIDARPGVVFYVQRQDMQAAIQRISKILQVDEQGDQSGILAFTYSDPDPRAAASLLSAVVSADVDLNRNLRSEEAAAQIKFLEDQLPPMEARVDSARKRLGQFQAEHKVLDLTEESQALLDRLTSLDQAIMTASLQRVQVQQQFGSASPALRAVLAQQDTLQMQRATLEAQVARLPVAAQSVLQLQANLDVASTLYTGLLTSIQQLQVVRAGTVGDLDIVDFPVDPTNPSGPPRLIIALVGVLGGLLIGAIVAVLRRAFLQRVQDPALLESALRVPVISVLPFSSAQAKYERSRPRDDERELLLAEQNRYDPAVEAMRGLRTSLQFLLPKSERPIVCISGPVSGVGKSFISANLAHLAASPSTRVLVVDADMRRGHLNRYFGLSAEPGLSGLLSNTVDLNEIIRPTGIENLSIICAGVFPPNPAELLLRPTLRSLFDYAVTKFDLVIVDAPPILPVTDGILVANEASMNFIVARAGEHRIRELATTLARYRQNGIRPDGFVFNCLRTHAGGYGYHYGYKYTYKPTSE